MGEGETNWLPIDNRKVANTKVLLVLVIGCVSQPYVWSPFNRVLGLIQQTLSLLRTFKPTCGMVSPGISKRPVHYEEGDEIAPICLYETTSSR